MPTNLLSFLTLKNFGPINFTRLVKKRFTLQQIHSFINKGTNQIDCKRFQDILFGMKLDGFIYKKGRGKKNLFH